MTLERYGTERPRLYAPEAHSGLAEDLLPQMLPASYDLIGDPAASPQYLSARVPTPAAARPSHPAPAWQPPWS